MIWTSLVAQSKRQLWMSLFVATLIAVVFYHFARFYQGSAYSWLFVLGWVPVLLNWLRAALGLLYRLDRQPFRTLDLGLESDQVAPGNDFEIEIRLEARRETRLERVSAELRCTRYKSTERGKQVAVLESDERVLEEDLSLSIGDAKEYRVVLPVASSAPFSYRSMEGKIAWSIHIVVDVDEWGKIEDGLEVTVAPG